MSPWLPLLHSYDSSFISQWTPCRDDILASGAYPPSLWAGQTSSGIPILPLALLFAPTCGYSPGAACRPFSVTNSQFSDKISTSSPDAQAQGPVLSPHTVTIGAACDWLSTWYQWLYMSLPPPLFPSVPLLVSPSTEVFLLRSTVAMSCRPKHPNDQY